jgi:hypothetical protein
MTKTDLVVRPHLRVPGAYVVELWYKGIFIGEVTGADGPGVRVISKYPLEATTHSTQPPNVIEVMLHPERMSPPQ